MNLDKRVTIRRRAQTQDGAGQTRPTWKNMGEYWASVRPISARKLQNASGPRAEVTHEIILRHGPNIAPSDEIVYEGRVFEVVAPINVDEASRYLNVQSKENASNTRV